MPNRLQAALDAGLALHAHVGCRGGIVANQDRRQSGRPPATTPECRCLGAHFVTHCGTDRFAVDDLRHVSSAPVISSTEGGFNPHSERINFTAETRRRGDRVLAMR